MIRQMLRNGQITLPKEAVKRFNLKTKDLVEVTIDRCGIYLKPLAIEEFSEAEYAKLAKKLDDLKAGRKGKTYQTTEDARRHLGRLSHR